MPLTIALSVLLVIAIVIFLITRRLSKGDYTSQLYRKMCFTALLSRVGPRPDQTPSEYCAKLASIFPGLKQAFKAVGEAYNKIHTIEENIVLKTLKKLSSNNI